MVTGHDAVRDRCRGVLLGSAVGDALGATLEFMSRDAIRSQYGELKEIIGGGWLGIEAGEVTDDTQMTLCIASSLSERKRFDAEDIANRFVGWLQSNPRDIGHTTRNAIDRLSNGVPWDEAGEQTHQALRPRDASNGSIMRCAPVAVFTRADADENRRNSIDSSRITHANPLCLEACVALNAAIAALLHDPDVDPVNVALNATTNEWVKAALEGVVEQTSSTLDAGGYVLSTLQSAFWAVTAHGSLEEAIVAAVNLGLDADTTGAVAGALAGARWGMSGIPQRWLDTLLARDKLLGLADNLFDLGGR